MLYEHLSNKYSRLIIMTDHNLCFYPYTSFTNAHLPLVKVVALWFGKLVILDPVGASWATIGGGMAVPQARGLEDHSRKRREERWQSG